MSDPLDARPSADEVPPSPEEPQDAASLQSAGDLDEDELGVDPMEDGVDLPDRWSAVTQERPTAAEQHEGETLDERLAEERPGGDAEFDKPLAETRMYELDDSVDERAEAEIADGGADDPLEQPGG